jgi:hypothetical protein
MLVHADGRIEGGAKLAGWLGLEALPDYLSELAPVVPPAQLAALTEAVSATQRGTRPLSCR